MDAVFYSVALNAIAHEEETEAIQEESSHKKAESSERTAQGLERNRPLSRSTGCGGATMGEIRNACGPRRQVHVCHSGGSGYLGREAGLGVPVHIATENMDLSADLKLALAHARAGKHDKKKKPSDEKGRLVSSQYNSCKREPLFVPGGMPCTFWFPGSQSFSCGDC